MVEKTGSLATIIWNPWIQKCKNFADMPDNEYLEIVCIEAANAGSDVISLPPGINTLPYLLVTCAVDLIGRWHLLFEAIEAIIAGYRDKVQNMLFMHLIILY